MVERRNIKTILLSWGLSLPAYATTSPTQIEDRLVHATSATSNHLFLRNHAIVKSDRTIISVSRGQNRREYTVTGNPDNGGSTIKMVSDEKDDAAGILLPLGGAAFGVTTGASSYEKTFDNQDTSRASKETFNQRRWDVRFLVDLTDSLRGSFAYHYLGIENEIHGGFNINNNDRTHYKGAMTGFTISAFQELNKGGVGVFHHPPMRGKSTVEGEQKIITHPGVTGLDIIFNVSGELNLGISGERWFYKKDDFMEMSTSPIDDRRISLNGLDLEQYHFKTQVIRVGCDYSFSKELRLRSSLARNNAVFLFRDDAVPGDNQDFEKGYQYYELRVALSYSRNDFNIEFGKGLARRELGEIRDYKSSLGYGEYEDYKAKDDVTYLALSFAN